MKDVIIIGAGVVGCAIARSLSRYDLKCLVLEKENDVGTGATKANSGIIHGGYDAEPGTKKAKFNVLGNQMFEQLESQLHFGFKKIGSYVLAFSEEEASLLKELYDRGIKNGVKGMAIHDANTIKIKEPHISDHVVSGLYCSEAGIASPYELAIALAENAISNGVEFKLNTEVININVTDSIEVKTKENTYMTRYLINAAGYFSDYIAQMIGDNYFKILPRKGQYVLMDKTQGHLANTVLFQVPTKLGKGILVTPTVHGNLMIGPNSESIDDRYDKDTNPEILKHIVQTARKTVPNFDIKHALTSFSGIRATCDLHDFIIESSKSSSNIIHVAGIESPGLTSSPAIAEEVIHLLEKEGLSLMDDAEFNPIRKSIIKKKDASFKGNIDDSNPDLNIICRCEKVTESEIRDALSRGLKLNSLDAIKRRTRAGMGFCQGAFCGPRVKGIISDMTGIPKEQITKTGSGSSILPDRPNIKNINF